MSLADFFQSRHFICPNGNDCGARVFRTIWLGSLIFFALFVARPARGGESELSFDQVLERYARATELPNKISFNSREESSLIVTSGGKRSETRYLYQMTLKKDGTQVDSSRVAFIAEDGAPFAKPNATFRSVVSSDGPLTRDEYAGLPIYAYVRRDVAWATLVALAEGSGNGQAIEGYLPGTGKHTVAELMRDGTDQKIEILRGVDGRLAYGLQSHTVNGDYKLSVDPLQNFLPIEIDVRRDSTSIINDKPAPNGMTSDVVQVRSIRVILKNDRLVPVSVIVHEIESYEGGKTVEITTTTRRTDIQFNPQFAGSNAFRMELPEGTPVHFDPPDGLQYQWHDGKIVPVYDPKIASAIDGEVRSVNPFPRTRSSLAATWLAIASVVVGGIGITVFIIHRGIFRETVAAIPRPHPPTGRR